MNSSDALSPPERNSKDLQRITTVEAADAEARLVVEVVHGEHDSEEEKKQAIQVKQDHQTVFAQVVYLSAAAILGASLRVYLGRFFGGDCEDSEEIPDFLTPASKTICVTSNGRSAQTGGALFRDLPANIFGSFVMGLISSSKTKIPWLSKDHRAQKDDLFHLMISTGFCGSLTTFASWNTQMVVMMVRTVALDDVKNCTVWNDGCLLWSLSSSKVERNID